MVILENKINVPNCAQILDESFSFPFRLNIFREYMNLDIPSPAMGK